jgi:hypothetical protein
LVFTCISHSIIIAVCPVGIVDSRAVIVAVINRIVIGVGVIRITVISVYLFPVSKAIAVAVRVVRVCARSNFHTVVEPVAIGII